MWSSRRLPPQAFGNVEAVIRRRGFADFVELLRLHTRRKNSARLRRPGRPHQAPFRRRSVRTFAGFRSPATSPMTRPGLACHRRLAVRCQLLLVRRTRRRARRGGHRRHGKGVRCRRGSLYGAARRLGCWASDRRWAPVADAASCGPRCGAHCSRAVRPWDGCKNKN